MIARQNNKVIYSQSYFDNMDLIRKARMEHTLSLEEGLELPHDCVTKAVYDRKWQTWKFWLKDRGITIITAERLHKLSNWSK